jgi:hypothetical protein
MSFYSSETDAAEWLSSISGDYIPEAEPAAAVEVAAVAAGE